jgi:chemotaxis family two-component system response regulator Rcp1
LTHFEFWLRSVSPLIIGSVETERFQKSSDVVSVRSDAPAGEPVFRILVVEDNPADAFLLKETFQILSSPYHLDWVKDGSDALDLLYRRGSYANTSRPSLVLMDLNMPGVNGLEVLRAIKSDPDLSMVPVIMFSASAWPEEVRQSYGNYANGYVQKPTTLEQSVRLVRAIEAFWMDFVVLAGPSVAGHTGEARHPAMSTDGLTIQVVRITAAC